jgi:hypothetical protein
MDHKSIEVQTYPKDSSDPSINSLDPDYHLLILTMTPYTAQYAHAMTRTAHVDVIDIVLPGPGGLHAEAQVGGLQVDQQVAVRLVLEAEEIEENSEVAIRLLHARHREDHLARQNNFMFPIMVHWFLTRQCFTPRSWLTARTFPLRRTTSCTAPLFTLVNTIFSTFFPSSRLID